MISLKAFLKCLHGHTALLYNMYQEYNYILRIIFSGFLENQFSSSSTSELPHGASPAHGHLSAQTRQFSNSTSSLTSRAASDTPSTSSAPPAMTSNKSRWQKLFSALKKNKGGGGAAGPGGSADAFCLKHSHNCSNSFLRAGISNMKGYKKANQDR